MGGSYIDGDSASHAFLYDDGVMTDLGTLGGRSSWAYGINGGGLIAGYSTVEGSINHAFLHDGTTMNDLGTLGGVASWALGINNNGHVVGTSNVAESYGRHAFLYDGTEMTDLGTLGGDSSWAEAINDNGQVVGHSFLGTGDRHAFLYDETEGLLDLNDLIGSSSGWELTFAYDINSLGQIVGCGSIGGETHAFLMTPVPEPATFVLLGLGGMMLRRKARKA